MAIITEKAPAKINLGLKILRKRPDGFHDILSLFQTITLCDELDLSGQGSGLDCDCPDLSCGPDNLVLKADRVFREATGFNQPVHFSLRKRIPAGAGLGGGSSDAAAALRGLARMSGGEAGVSGELLRACAEKLGSDVPFLLAGGTAVVEGRGEHMEPVAWPFDFTYLLVYPGFGVSTGWAYAQVRQYAGESGLYRDAVESLKTGHPNKEKFLEALSNDFEPAVFPHYPVLAEIKQGMLSCGAVSSFLTGSGSTIVGLFEEPETARRCVARFQGKGFEVFIANKTE
ncbi:MAG: 4-(cytidine 5'-diphospho)-2-C-methyl-D-erythritol kinase [Candidatus Latescibacterota bacterium]